MIHVVKSQNWHISDRHQTSSKCSKASISTMSVVQPNRNGHFGVFALQVDFFQNMPFLHCLLSYSNNMPCVFSDLVRFEACVLFFTVGIWRLKALV